MHPISNTGGDAEQSAAYQHPRKLRIDQIRIDGGTQPRVDINQDTVARYEQDLKLGATFPPVPVFFDGTTYWAAGGFHRILAHTRFGATEIDVDVNRGTVEDARWFSYAENKDHGLPRSNKDIERAVTAALGHPRAAEMSARAIAEYLGVSHVTVAAWKKRLPSGGQVDHLSEPAPEPGIDAVEPVARVVGKDGKYYPAKKKKKKAKSTIPGGEIIQRPVTELIRQTEPDDPEPVITTEDRREIQHCLLMDSLIEACETICFLRDQLRQAALQPRTAKEKKIFADAREVLNAIHAAGVVTEVRAIAASVIDAKNTAAPPEEPGRRRAAKRGNQFPPLPSGFAGELSVPSPKHLNAAPRV
jgi:hypothetical protein